MERKLNSDLIKLDPSQRLYQLPSPIIGLTGGVGTGKSTAATLMQNLGIKVINADHLVKAAYQSASSGNFIQQHFPQVINENGEISFRQLRELAFSNPDVLQQLEELLYPQLEGLFLNAFTQLASPPVVVYDVPLLFEKGLDTKVDLTICIHTSEDIQCGRIEMRDNLSTENAKMMITSQLSLSEKVKRADYAIDNSGDHQKLEELICSLMEQITVIE